MDPVVYWGTKTQILKQSVFISVKGFQMDTSKSLMILAAFLIFTELLWNHTLSLQIHSVEKEKNTPAKALIDTNEKSKDISDIHDSQRISRKRPREDSQEIGLQTHHPNTKQKGLMCLKGKSISNHSVSRINHLIFFTNPYSEEHIDNVEQEETKDEKWTQSLIQNFHSCTSPIKKAHHLISLQEASKYMPTSIIQVTWYGLLTDTTSLIKEFDIGDVCCLYDKLESLTLSYKLEMKKRIVSGGQYEPGNKFKSIFTMDGQRNLGTFGIRLETNWSVFQENQLFEFWAHYLDIYLQVSGTMKALLETQVIMTNLIKTEEKVSNLLDKVEELFPIFPDWSNVSIQEHRESLVNYIRSLDEKYTSNSHS
ncbi:uncharacterized protein MELLADRAFT_64876 [Melampsora larici-populina 98AG31]|uniref:Uncharacterized protein n=1 Tax=Melampsora larici-populina (strain 98AG31 / pathotype 3-4-7) TaxID=747676 RepID=F4RT48_MELLP|nr:uncharacterized protein MELLADRAFT_64876 [Melampsora larici-populina 98AG31]EGG04490.1 hypothetical protein MELLADRAFT_64876 [Melampsora larici-populina 98AG31]